MINKKQAGAGEKPTFPKDTLIAQAQKLFNQPPEVIAGALYAVEEPITIDQAREKVEDFLTRPIQKEGGK